MNPKGFGNDGRAADKGCETFKRLPVLPRQDQPQDGRRGSAVLRTGNGQSAPVQVRQTLFSAVQGHGVRARVLILSLVSLGAPFCTFVPAQADSLHSAQPYTSPVTRQTHTALPHGHAAAHSQPQASRSSPYLTPDTQPDPTQYLPPPPQPGSLRHQTDEKAFAVTRGWKNDARWALAASDAKLQLPDLLNSFSCAAGFVIDAAKAPHLVALLRNMGNTEVPDMWKGKDYWRRTRPFVGTDNAICTEEDREDIAKTGAYPSGHTMLGWSLALVLTELLPDRSTAILQRGRVFGESRIVCGVHWESDVQEGYLAGAAEVAAMHGSAAFRADMDAARAELAAVRATAPKPDTKQCEIEHEAAIHSPL